jgi:hypothetical protein
MVWLVRVPRLGQLYVATLTSGLPKRFDVWYDSAGRSWNVQLYGIEVQFNKT